jgi:hypothetical protein
MEPLTALMTEEQRKKKQEQQKAKAPPPGSSRILSRATREQNKKAKQPSNQPAPLPTPPATVTTNSQKQQTPAVQTNESKTLQKSALNESPRSVVAPVVANESTKSTKHEPNQTESADEWANWSEELNPEVNFELCEKMLKDVSFLGRLKQRLITAKSLMFEAKIEGASMFRDLCKILCNLLSIEFNEFDENEDSDENEQNSDSVVNSKKLKASNKKEINTNMFLEQMKSFEYFCNYLELPQFFTDLMKQFLNEKSNLKLLKEV